MLRKIRERTGLPEADPRPVLTALREAVPEHEMHDVLSHLPDETNALFCAPAAP